ncbi:hypothetical protein K1719_026299 [Acacia pycnantha]|nr:hypothetical protein K1719_026299 [Acacia pycnantha]
MSFTNDADISKGKAKWALWSDSLCNREHPIFNPIPILHQSHSWRHSLLPPRPSKKFVENCVFFFSILFSCLMLVESLMMIVASIVPEFLMGIIIGSGIQTIMILAGGLFRFPNELPRIFWKYPLCYVAFHRYAYEGLFKNEFEGLMFGSSSGEHILRSKWQVNMSYSKWVDLAILLGMIVLYRVVFLSSW